MDKVYPQSINGYFRKLKNNFSYLLLLIYFGSSWLRWDRGFGVTDQAIIGDLPGRKAYIFGLVIHPDELYFLTALLVIAAFGLFIVTTILGRIWCGFGCPHTVFVDLFVKVEEFFQGDRNARRRLDTQPWSKEKFQRKLYTHIVWIILAFAFAFGWVCYFYGAKELLHDLLRLKVGVMATLWLLALTASTYFFAGFMRQRVCMYICPYGRFQSAMVDADTMHVHYQDWRGEPRGYQKSSTYAEGSEAGRNEYGDCIDCFKCVYVCPMGIDIRDGAHQMACIGCGLCIDACNDVMSKMGRQPNLISFSSSNMGLESKASRFSWRKILKFNTLLFITIFIIASASIIYGLGHRDGFNFNLTHTRGALYTIMIDGRVRNSFELRLENKANSSMAYALAVKEESLAQYVELKLRSSQQQAQDKGAVMFEVAAETEYNNVLFIYFDQKIIELNQSSKSNDIELELREINSENGIEESKLLKTINLSLFY